MRNSTLDLKMKATVTDSEGERNEMLNIQQCVRRWSWEKKGNSYAEEEEEAM